MIFAQSYALVVGVGEYKNLDHSKNLRGVPKDIEHIKEILKTLGINNIHPLMNFNATRRAVIGKFKRYINSPHNRRGNSFIFYYTGHGVQIYDRNRDEQDGKDEAFALYDVSISGDKVINGGILLDDELYYLLSQIKSKKILILDKCYSDSSYRSVALSYSKSFGKDYSISDSFFRSIQSDKRAKDAEDTSLGKFVIGTVKGDIHDIGQKLVSMMCEGSGFEVINLGINNPVENYLEAIDEHEPVIVGMSALLTTTMPYMGVVVEEMEKRGLRKDVHLMCGGAPLNQEFADSIGVPAYGRDAARSSEMAEEHVRSLGKKRGHR
jgi:methylmalonyl-CoA mutase cobalamin-binding domain/chain